MHTTRWSPDTCDCVVEYDWDDAEPTNVRKHTLKKMVNTCPLHKNVQDPLSKIIEHNKKKV